MKYISLSQTRHACIYMYVSMTVLEIIYYDRNNNKICVTMFRQPLNTNNDLKKKQQKTPRNLCFEF